MRRVMKNWLHWSCDFNGRHFSFGWHEYGNCWTFKFQKHSYLTFNYYRFWRLFISINKDSINKTGERSEQSETVQN